MGVRIGDATAVQQPTRVGYSPSRGYYSIYSWKGPQAAIDAMAGQLTASGYEWETQQASGGNYIITANMPGVGGGGGGGTDEPVNTWEFFAQEHEKDMLEANIAYIENISTANKNLLRSYFADPPTPSEKVWVGDGTQTAAGEVYNLFANLGVKSVRVSQPTIRHTMTVSQSYSTKTVLTNVGSVLGNAAMTNEGVPGAFLVDLPNIPSLRTGMAYGWYKKFPTIQVSARQKVQVVREWEYGLWSTILYGNPV